MDTHKVILLILLVILVIILLGILLVPRYRKMRKQSKVVIQFTDTDQEELDDLYIGIIPDTETRKKVTDYTLLFLNKKEYNGKCHIYISKEIYDRIKELIPLVAPGISCSTFINNVLVHHLDENMLILRAISETNFKQTMKSWNTILNPISQ